MANFYGQYIGFGSGGVLAPDIGVGFTSGGLNVSAAQVNTIDKFSFTDDSTCADHGDLATATDYHAGHSSTDYGFSAGGRTPTVTSAIHKWAFAGSGVSSSSAGSLSYSRRGCCGVSNAGDQYAYSMGGYTGVTVSGTMDVYNMTNTSGSFDTASLSSNRYGSGGSESSTRGYISGGGPTTTVDKIVFASFTTGVAERALGLSTGETQATNSTTHSYTMGGSVGSLGSTAYDAIQKFSFADELDSTKTGVLTRGRRYASTFHSRDYAYICGGGESPVGADSEKMAFASDTDTANIGVLTLARNDCAGHQSLTLEI